MPGVMVVLGSEFLRFLNINTDTPAAETVVLLSRKYTISYNMEDSKGLAED